VSRILNPGPFIRSRFLHLPRICSPLPITVVLTRMSALTAIPISNWITTLIRFQKSTRSELILDFNTNEMKKYIIFITACLFTFLGCEKPLAEEVFSALGPTNFAKTAEDAEALLNSVYAQSQGYRDLIRDYLALGEETTDIFIERNGAINTFMKPFEDF